MLLKCTDIEGVHAWIGGGQWEWRAEPASEGETDRQDGKFPCVAFEMQKCLFREPEVQGASAAFEPGLRRTAGF